MKETLLVYFTALAIGHGNPAAADEMANVVVPATNKVKQTYIDEGFTPEQANVLSVYGFALAQNAVCGQSVRSDQSLVAMSKMLSEKHAIPEHLFFDATAETAKAIVLALGDNMKMKLSFCQAK